MKAVVDETGRIQLPEDLRVQLGLKPGDEVVLERRIDEWVLRAAQTPTGLAWEGCVLVHRGANIASATIEELIDEDRDNRFRGLSDGFKK